MSVAPHKVAENKADPDNLNTIRYSQGCGTHQGLHLKQGQTEFQNKSGNVPQDEEKTGRLTNTMRHKRHNCKFTSCVIRTISLHPKPTFSKGLTAVNLEMQVGWMQQNNDIEKNYQKHSQSGGP